MASISFDPPRKSLEAQLEDASKLLTFKLIQAEGPTLKNSSERLRELALLTSYEAWREFLEEMFLRCMFKAGNQRDKPRFRPFGHDTLKSCREAGGINSILGRFRNECDPQFSQMEKVLTASKAWFGERHPFRWIDDEVRLAILDGARHLRNDVVHGGSYSSESEGAMSRVFMKGHIPERARRRTIGYVLGQTGVDRDGDETLIEHILEIMEEGGSSIAEDAQDW